MAELSIEKLSVSKKNIRKFVKFSWEIYKDYEHWVPPLIGDEVANICSGSYHESGIIQPFFVRRGDKIVGRIIAHYDTSYNEMNGKKRGCFGFFECIDDHEAAAALFDAASEWLSGQGMNEIYGPLNFIVYDPSGLLVDGFEHRPFVDQAYTPPYYIDLLEQYGFKKDIDWYAYRADYTLKVPEIIERASKRVLRENPGLRVRTLDMKKFYETAEQTRQVFNKAWENNRDHLPLTKTKYKEIVDKLKQIIVPELIITIEDGDTIAAININIPDINQVLKKLNGRLFPFGIFKLIRGLKTIDGIRVYIMGVMPEYRDRGIETLIYTELYKTAIRLGYRVADMSVVVETNNNLLKVLDNTLTRYKTYRLYTKAL